MLSFAEYVLSFNTNAKMVIFPFRICRLSGGTSQDLAKDRGTTEGLGAKPTAFNKFLRFSLQKNTHFSSLFC